jgi:hypothetical protein
LEAIRAKWNIATVDTEKKIVVTIKYGRSLHVIPAL